MTGLISVGYKTAPILNDIQQRKAAVLPDEQALQYIEEQSGIHFDPVVVQRFMNMMHSQSEADNQPVDL